MVKKTTKDMDNTIIYKLEKYFTIYWHSIYNQNILDAKAVIILADGGK